MTAPITRSSSAVLVTAVVLLGPTALDGQAAARPSLIADSARFSGAEWSTTPVMSLDSSKAADANAVREIRRAWFIAPGRLAFEGKLTKGGKWALFSVVDGAVRRVLVSGDETTEPDGRKKKFNLDWALSRPAGSVVMQAAVDSRLPNESWLFDGTGWQRMLGRGDTLALPDGPIVVEHFNTEVAGSGSLLMFVRQKNPERSGYVWLSGPRSATPIVMQGDSVAGIGAFDVTMMLRQIFGVPSGLRDMIPTRDGWYGMLRTHQGGRNYVDHIVVSDGEVNRVLFKADTFDTRGAADSIAFVARAPSGEMILMRGQSIGVVTPDGTWRQLLSASDVAPPKNGGFRLGDVTWLDSTSSRALLTVWLRTQHTGVSAGSITVSTTYSLWPRMYLYDGRAASEVKPNEGVTAENIFMSWIPTALLRRVPGYDHGIVVDHPFKLAGQKAAVAFDAERGTFVPAPAFRTAAGAVPVTGIVGWNSGTEAVVRHNGTLMLLRRPSP